MVILNIAVKLFWLFGVDRTVQNQLGTEVYGNYFSFFQYAWIFSAVADMGITSLNNRLISEQPSRLSFYLHNLIFFKIILSIIVFVAMILIGKLIGYSTQELGLLSLVAINILTMSFYSFLRSNITGLHLFTSESILSVLDKFIMVVICSSFLWITFLQSYFDIYVFAGIQIFGYFVSSVVVYFLLKPHVKRHNKKLNFKFISKFVRTSAPYALLVLLMSLYTRTDSVLLERMLPDGNHQNGIYASGFRILDAFNMFAVLMASFLLPIFSRNIFKKQMLQPIVKQSFLFLLFPILGLMAFMVAYYKDIYALLYHSIPVEEGANVFILFVACFIPMSLSFIFGTLLTAKGKIKKLNYISVLALVFNIGLNIYFIPTYKSLGVAVIAVLTQSLVLVIQIYYCVQIFNFKIQISTVLKFVFLLVLALSLGFIFHYFTVPLILGLLLIGLVLLGFYFLFKFVQIEQIKLLKRS